MRESNANVFTLVESITDSAKNESEELLASDVESKRSIAYVEDQLRKETTIYKVLMMLKGKFYSTSFCLKI